jgi:hypothetical protein
MKKLLSFILTTLLVIGLAGVSFAYVEVNNNGKIVTNYQKATGGFFTATGIQTISGTPAVITGVMVVAGGTANQVELYDTSATATSPYFEAGVPQPGITNTVFEASVAANTASFFDLSQTPIRTTLGLEAAQAGLGGGFIVYTIQYP